MYYLYVKIYFSNLKVFSKESSIFKLPYRIPKINFYVLHNNFSYAQLFLAFLLQISPYDIDNFSLFFLQRDFCICLEPFFAFFVSLLQKDFGSFSVLLFGAFYCFLSYLLTIFTHV